LELEWPTTAAAATAAAAAVEPPAAPIFATDIYYHCSPATGSSKGGCNLSGRDTKSAGRF